MNRTSLGTNALRHGTCLFERVHTAGHRASRGFACVVHVGADGGALEGGAWSGALSGPSFSPEASTGPTLNSILGRSPLPSRP
jgi:hypothetical protein